MNMETVELSISVTPKGTPRQGFYYEVKITSPEELVSVVEGLDTSILDTPIKVSRKRGGIITEVVLTQGQTIKAAHPEGWEISYTA